MESEHLPNEDLGWGHEPNGARGVAPASWSAPALWRFGECTESGRGLPHSKTWRNSPAFLSKIDPAG